MEHCVRLLRCPHCLDELQVQGGSLRCAQGHTFDLAREGYVNFLAGQRVPPQMGDAPEMLRARRAFLQAGHYAPLLVALGPIIQAVAPSVVLDAGCGEGSYLQGLRPFLPPTGCWLGVDVAKTAVRMAAKWAPEAQFLVADIWQRLPVADASVDVLLNIFAPRNVADFARLLRPSGLLVVVIPAADHLRELRTTFGLLDVEEDKEARVVAQCAPYLTLMAAESVDIALHLSPPALSQLVGMMPGARQLTAVHQAALAQTMNFHTTAHFRLLSFKRALPPAE